MRLPNGERAVVQIEKLRDYCLDPMHFRGRHKARVFQLALGITQADAEVLRQRLLLAAVSEEAALGELDAFGQRYILDLVASHSGRTARIRSCWIIRTGEDFPRLTSCYVL